MKIRYIITVVLAVVGLASIIFPSIIKSWTNIPAADICSKADVIKLGGPDMCTSIVSEIQKEVSKWSTGHKKSTWKFNLSKYKS